MEKYFLELDNSQFYVDERWMRIDIEDVMSQLDRKQTQELIDFLQKHLHEIRE